ncbi:MAG TPA: hypothetical protein DCE27_04290 [Xanthomarina gelatinilytica]|nr:hypothetical protein [Xanthomarina gelatinilytica]
MIIPNLNEVTIISSIKDYIDQAHYNERDDRLTIMNYYEGINLEEEVMNYFDAEALRYAPPMAINITKKIIDARFITYKSAPQRKADPRYLELISNCDNEMIEVDRMTGLLGTIGVLRFYDEEKQMLQGHILTDFEPIYLPNNPEPVAVIYPLFNHGNAKVYEQEYVFWSDEKHFKIKKSGEIIHVNDEDVNPYGEIPILWSHLYPMLGNEWYRTGKGKMVANANLLYNVFGTQLSLGNMYQSLGQSVLTGVDETTRVKIDVSKLLVLPEGANYNIVSPSGSLAEIRSNMKWVVETTADALHLKINWASDTHSSSGEHQRILEMELTEAIMSDFETFRKFEVERFRLDKKILEAFNINVSDEYNIDFSEPHIPLSPAQEREEWMWKWDNGLATKKDWFRHYNPDFTDDQIDDMINEIQEEQPEENATNIIQRIVNG